MLFIVVFADGNLRQFYGIPFYRSGAGQGKNDAAFFLPTATIIVDCSNIDVNGNWCQHCITSVLDWNVVETSFCSRRSSGSTSCSSSTSSVVSTSESLLISMGICSQQAEVCYRVVIILTTCLLMHFTSDNLFLFIKHWYFWVNIIQLS